MSKYNILTAILLFIFMRSSQSQCIMITSEDSDKFDTLVVGKERRTFGWDRSGHSVNGILLEGEAETPTCYKNLPINNNPANIPIAHFKKIIAKNCGNYFHNKIVLLSVKEYYPDTIIKYNYYPTAKLNLTFSNKPYYDTLITYHFLIDFGDLMYYEETLFTSPAGELLEAYSIPVKNSLKNDTQTFVRLCTSFEKATSLIKKDTTFKLQDMAVNYLKGDFSYDFTYTNWSFKEKAYVDALKSHQTEYENGSYQGPIFKFTEVTIRINLITGKVKKEKDKKTIDMDRGL